MPSAMFGGGCQYHPLRTGTGNNGTRPVPCHTGDTSMRCVTKRDPSRIIVGRTTRGHRCFAPTSGYLLESLHVMETTQAGFDHSGVMPGTDICELKPTILHFC